MKKYIILFFIAATFIISCQKEDEYEPLNSFSDVGWYFSDTEGNLAVSIDDYITFSDLSQGVVSHEWTIGDGNYYLKMPIQRNDSIFKDKIIGNGSTTEKTISVWFRKAGLQSVRLYNTFNEKVTFRGIKGDEKVFIDAKEVEDKWVIDTTFVVDVYADIIPKIKIEQNGVVLDHTNPNDTIYVEAGDFLSFFDESTVGRADTWEWTVGSEKSNQQDAVLTLKKLGVFNGTFSISRRGQNIPGNFKFYKIPAPFKVIPSSKPFVVIPDEVMEREDQTIQVPFNGEFTPFTNQEAHFTVTVNGTPSDIATVSINPDDATILDIKMVDQIYRDDNITVSYDGNGSMVSTDTRVPNAFSSISVSMFQHEAIKFDFENGGDNFIAKTEGDGVNLPTTTIGISTEQAASGVKSLKIDASASGNWSAFINYIDTFELKAGVSVQYEYKVYKVSGASINFIAPWINKEGNTTVTQFWHNDIKNAPSDTWVTIRPGAKFASPTTFDDYNVYFRHNGQGTIYIDDLRIIEVDNRP